MGWLEGQVTLITGGASGIGRAVVRRFIEEGAQIGVMVLNSAQKNDLAKEFGDDIHVSVGDVRLLEDNDRAVAETVSRFGKLDTFVGNAGIWDFMASVSEMPRETLGPLFDDMFAINVRGYIFGARAALPELKRSKGSIILTASSSSYFMGGGGPIYIATKHAVVGLIRALAHELAPDIRVNGVAPGSTHTPLSGSAAAGQEKASLATMEGLDDLIGGLTPLGRIAQPEDHTAHYVLLASARNSGYTTGTIILNDGGVGVGKRLEA